MYVCMYGWISSKSSFLIHIFMLVNRKRKEEVEEEVEEEEEEEEEVYNRLTSSLR